MLGDYFCYPKTGGGGGGGGLCIKVAIDRDNIFNFELCLNCTPFFKFVSLF